MSLDTARKTEEDRNTADATPDARQDCNNMRTTIHDLTSECTVTKQASVRPKRSADNETNQEAFLVRVTHAVQMIMCQFLS